MTEVCSATRQAMSSYWKEHSANASIEEMMLDTNAAAMAGEETAEILLMLPDLHDKDVVELGAGIGRFTEHLAPTARHVVAVDFMEAFIEKNREDNQHFGNIDYLVRDVTKMSHPAASADVVFSNWLFMYLQDAEVMACFEKILHWLKEGGYFFLRESCYHRSGTKQRGDNPTQYRHPQRYHELLQAAFQPSDSQKSAGKVRGFGLELVFARPSRTYIKFKENRNQICWLLRKVPQTRHSPQQLDSYFSEAAVGKLEALFGQDFLSSGGLESTRLLCQRLRLQPGQKVLDVGCGLGGSAFHLSQTLGANVVAIDRSETMIGIAHGRANARGFSNVVFDIANVETFDLYEEGAFDVIYSRDVLMYVEQKQKVLDKFMKWLKPGGRLMVTDYCCDRKKYQTERFQSFLQENSYSLVSVGRYRQMLDAAGFSSPSVEDLSDWFCQLLETELEGLAQRKSDFISNFGKEQFEDHVKAWQKKLLTCRNRELLWTLFCAEKKEE